MAHKLNFIDSVKIIQKFVQKIAYKINFKKL